MPPTIKAKGLAQLSFQVFGVGRLDEKAVDLVEPCLLGVLIRVLAGQDQDRHVLVFRHRAVPDFADELVAIDLGHLDVADDEIDGDVGFSQFLQSIGAVIGGQHISGSKHAEDSGNETLRELLVIDNHHVDGTKNIAFCGFVCHSVMPGSISRLS